MISLSLALNCTKLLCGVYSMFCKIYFEASDQIVRGAVWVWARLNLKLLNDRLLLLLLLRLNLKLLNVRLLILRGAPREPAESSLDPIWQLFLQRHIASHRITSHHITAHHITLHRITSRYNPVHITSRHITEPPGQHHHCCQKPHFPSDSDNLFDSSSW